jgi:hypothetical protein
VTDPAFDARLQQALMFIESKGVRRSTAAPPLYRLFWRMGLKVPPPLMAGFWAIALLMGGFFGLFWGVVMWLLMWGRNGMPLAFAALLALVAGVLFGLLMAAVLRSQARNKQIPAWKDFVP